jgi:hypothetical protein
MGTGKIGTVPNFTFSLRKAYIKNNGDRQLLSASGKKNDRLYSLIL